MKENSLRQDNVAVPDKKKNTIYSNQDLSEAMLQPDSKRNSYIDKNEELTKSDAHQTTNMFHDSKIYGESSYQIPTSRLKPVERAQSDYQVHTHYGGAFQTVEVK